jgi:flagellar hook-associated protein 2
MASIQFGGVVSGLNTQGIIDALVAVEKQPLTVLQAREATLTSQKAAYGQLGTAMDDLIAKIKSFTVTSAGASRSATTTDSSILTATASTSAAVATYQISVDRLATATRAVSTGSIGAAVTGAVDTSLTLSKANLTAPITAGNMALTVDGTTVQVAVGDPATTTLQNVMDNLSSALAAQLQATDPGSTVSATIVGGKLQLAISGNTTTHTIGFGDVGDTSNLATALGLGSQGVTNVQNATINASAYLDPTLSSLNLPGTVTAGQISAIVDGTIVHYTIGDPATTTLDQIMAGLGKAISDQLVAGGANKSADPTAGVTVSASGNRLQLTMSGATLLHSLSFGAASDTSNALGILGIANASATNASNPTVTGSTNLGVARMLGPLDNAGLTGLASTASGVLTINGTAIAYNTTTESIATIISRINNSNAGVIASVDRTNDQVVLTKKDTGALAIDITDTTGTLGAALRLAPGTTNAQVIGSTSQVTVDGRSVTSTSNTVTNAIDGVTLNLVSKSPMGQTETLTVGVDETAVQTALTSLVTSFNHLGDILDSLTATTPGTSGGTAGTASQLAGDPTAMTMFLSLRDTIFQTVGSGTINSLGALGLNTGAVGAAVGTTNRLMLDTAKLSTALTTDPNAVANLLDKTTGPLGALLTQLQAYEDPSNKNAYIQAHTAGLTTDITEVQHSEADRQVMIDDYTRMIEAQYTAMEATLALLQSQSQQIAAQLGYTTSSTTSSSSGSGLSNSSSGG